MSWEALTAIATLVTAAVIAITAVIGVRQLAELRRATMFEGAKRITDQWNAIESRKVREYVLRELPSRLKDPSFRAELLDSAPLDPQKHPEQLFLETTEEIGAYVRYDLLNTPAVLCVIASTMISGWESIHEVITLRQQAHDNPYVWDNTEALYEIVRGFARYASRQTPRLRPSTGNPFEFS
jgi:hypothetical protein